MKKFKQLAVAAIALSSLMVASNAQAISTLSGTFTVDDEFTFYLSTNNIEDGDELGSNAVWNESTTFSADLLDDQDYYLHVRGSNVENNHPWANPSGFLGDFFLSDINSHEFSVGGLDGSTGSGAWTYGFAGWDEGLTVENATAPNGANRDFGGANSLGVAQSGLADIVAQQWIWSDNHAPEVNTAYFTLEIKAVSGDVSNVPVPGAVWLFGSGLLGFIGMRKKAKKA